LLYQASGESERLNFGFLSSSSEVKDGAIISVTKIPPPEGERVDIDNVVRDVFAILASTVTIMVLAKQL